MQALAGEVWLVLSLLGALSVLGMMTAIASCLRDEAAVHNLRVEVNHMRNAYLRTVLESDNYSADPVAGLRLSGGAAGSDRIMEVGSE